MSPNVGDAAPSENSCVGELGPLSHWPLEAMVSVCERHWWYLPRATGSVKMAFLLA